MRRAFPVTEIRPSGPAYYDHVQQHLLLRGCPKDQLCVMDRHRSTCILLETSKGSQCEASPISHSWSQLPKPSYNVIGSPCATTTLLGETPFGCRLHCRVKRLLRISIGHCPMILCGHFVELPEWIKLPVYASFVNAIS